MINNWITQIEFYKNNYKNGKPFEHTIIPMFFKEEIAEEINEKFPLPTNGDDDWNFYHNPIEHKYSLNKFDKYAEIKRIFEYLQTDECINYIRKITDIEDLEIDPYLHGAGVHVYPNNGKLDIHLDYNIHPITKKERRVNLIIYFNKDWDEEYGGELKLYDDKFNEIKIENFCMWNSAILFRTSDISYHGLPEPINCPENKYRKSLAIYYVSNPRKNSVERYKAEFFPKQNQEVNEKLKKLYEIRKTRLITNEDLKEYPNWKTDGNGYW
jgi:Rps23 Pro-64 3,4-dihydroxylase Tpa1-like proline 4-hydroxylase